MSGQWLWFPHPTLVWVAARVTSAQGADEMRGETASGEAVSVPASVGEGLESAAEAAALGEGGVVANLVELDEFGEGAILHQLRERYERDSIYTSVSSILVSVNPFKQLPIYGASVMARYKAAGAGGSGGGGAGGGAGGGGDGDGGDDADGPAPAPHIFGVAAAALRGLAEDRESQSVVISGESGAGKTECTKLILQYLSDMAGQGSGVEQKILQSNPVLEAFGNAKTLRNNNSSRFGKFMSIHFDGAARISGASVVSYLLEKSRVVRVGGGERSYHVFYSLCAGAGPGLAERLRLGPPSSFHYLAQGGPSDVPGLSDEEEFGVLSRALAGMGFSEADVDAVWCLLAALLHLGNVEFAAADSGAGDASAVTNPEQCAFVASLLGIDAADLERALLYRSVTIRGSVSMIPLRVDSARDTRDALAKAAYHRLFEWVIKRVNATLATGAGDSSSSAPSPGGASSLTIGVLDIFGFEVFDENLLEQFFINYANEKLQQHFNTHIFKMEQAEYAKEGVHVQHVDFVDNQACLDLIEGRPGVLRMLDEEGVVPNGSDIKLVEKMHTQFASVAPYSIVRKRREAFVVNHYAGPVTYEVTGFMEKNRDKLHDTLVNAMRAATTPLVRQLFRDNEAEENEADAEAAAAAAAAVKGGDEPSVSFSGRRRGRGGGGKSRAAFTLGSQFRGQLGALVDTLQATAPHFVRCVKPNSDKAPNLFDSPMVLRQMRYAGLFEAVRIRKTGYPFRKAYAALWQRYRVVRVLLPPDGAAVVQRAAHAAGEGSRDACEALLDALQGEGLIGAKGHCAGKTKVFFRQHQRDALESLRERALERGVVAIQSFARGLAARRHYATMLRVRDSVRAAVKARALEPLAHALEEADELAGDDGEDAFPGIAALLEDARELLDRLYEERRVAGLVRDAVAARDLAPLQGALDQAARLGLASCGDADTVALLGRAAELRAELERGQRARKGLAAALRDGGRDALVAALREADEAGVGGCEAAAEARSVLERLEEELAAFARLDGLAEDARARGAAADGKALAAAIEAAEGLPADSAREASLAAASDALRVHFAARFAPLRAAGLREDEAEARDALLPALGALPAARCAWAAPLAGEVRAFLAAREEARIEAMAEAEREAARKERERREAEEAARAAAEREAEEAEGGDAVPDMPSGLGAPPPPAMRRPLSSSESRRHTAVKRHDQREAEVCVRLEEATRAFDRPAMRRLLAEADELGGLPASSKPLMERARFLCFGASDEEFLVERLAAATEAYDADLLETLLAEADRHQVEHPQVLVSRSFLASLEGGGGGAAGTKGGAAAAAGGSSSASSLAVPPPGKQQRGLSHTTSVTTLPPPPPPLPAQGRRGEHAAEPSLSSRSRPPPPSGPPPSSKLRRVDSAVHASQTDLAQYHAALLSKTAYPFRQFPLLRREGNYAKRHYLSKKDLKRNRLVHQSEPIPRSLFKLSTAYCGGTKPSKAAKELAKQTFNNVLGVMGDRYHQFPAALARDVVQAGAENELLRDECYCQLIKQTSENPSPDSTLRGWKLIYLCLMAFPPSSELMPYLVAHIAHHMLQAVRPRHVVGFDTVADVATHCYCLWYKESARHACKRSVVPEAFQIKLLLDGGLTLHRAQEAGASADAKEIAKGLTMAGAQPLVGPHLWSAVFDQLLASDTDVWDLELGRRTEAEVSASRSAAAIDISGLGRGRDEPEEPPPARHASVASSVVPPPPRHHGASAASSLPPPPPPRAAALSSVSSSVTLPPPPPPPGAGHERSVSGVSVSLPPPPGGGAAAGGGGHERSVSSVTSVSLPPEPEAEPERVRELSNASASAALAPPPRVIAPPPAKPLPRAGAAPPPPPPPGVGGGAAAAAHVPSSLFGPSPPGSREPSRSVSGNASAPVSDSVPPPPGGPPDHVSITEHKKNVSVTLPPAPANVAPPPPPPAGAAAAAPKPERTAPPPPKRKVRPPPPAPKGRRQP